MRSFEVHSNERARRKNVRLGLEQVENRCRNMGQDMPQMPKI